MNRIIERMRPKLLRFCVKFARNWKPKLITLALAILVWVIVKYSSSDDYSWDAEDPRLVIPE